jgi:hypothetical protein
MVKLCEFGVVDRSFFSTCQTNFLTGEAYNPYGIDIPFQFDKRDGTMTATDGVEK